MRINKIKDGETRFSYESSTFRFSSAVCDCAAIRSGTRSSTIRSEPSGSRGPRLFSHPNVWNTCPLLLQEYGYSPRIRPYSTSRVSVALSLACYYARWDEPLPYANRIAWPRFVTSTSPTECRKPYWWRIQGPSVLSELINQWENELVPRIT